MNNNSYVIRGGNVVCEDGVLPSHDVVVIDGRIARVEPTPANAALDVQPNPEVGLLPVVDARGAYVAPGLIDIHSDYVENVASPRPSVVMNLSTSLYKADRELVSHGITTIYHSLSVYGSVIFDHKPIRNFENVSALIDRVAGMRAEEERDHLIRHRLHMRVELDSVDLYDDIERYLTSGKVDLVSFMDHTPGQGQYRDLLVFGDTLRGYRDVTDEEVRDIVLKQQQSKKLTYAQLSVLSGIARERGISIASHDDDSEDKLEFMGEIGAGISEFPITLDIARSARERGMHTLAGAPNVLMGHSHSGNLSAREAVCDGAIDILCSDYYPAALLDAVFALHRLCGLDIARAFALVTINPARAVGVGDEVGSIEVGKRADVLLVREISCGEGGGQQTMPVVTRAFVGGHSVFRSHYPDQPMGYGKEEKAQGEQAGAPAFEPAPSAEPAAATTAATAATAAAPASAARIAEVM